MNERLAKMLRLFFIILNIVALNFVHLSKQSIFRIQQRPLLAFCYMKLADVCWIVALVYCKIPQIFFNTAVACLLQLLWLLSALLPLTITVHNNCFNAVEHKRHFVMVKKRLTRLGREGIELANIGAIKRPVYLLFVTENAKRTKGGGPGQ